MATTPLEYTPLEAIPGIISDLNAAFASRTTYDIAWRKAQLRQFWRLVDENEAAFRDALKADLGKPLVEAQGLEISLFKNEILQLLENLDTWLADEHPTTPAAFQGLSPTIKKQPKGTCLVLGTWNYPLFLVASPFLGVIASGNTGIMKPSEQCPATASLLTALVPRYLDTACIRIVNGGADVVQALLAHQLGHVFYTGGAHVGKLVMAAAARTLTPVTLELGGKSPAIVSRHADVALAAKRIAWGKFAAAGQTCVAPDYALVEAAVLPSFVDEMKKTIAATYGQGVPEKDAIARIVSRTHFERVVALLRATRGTLVCGGQTDAANLLVAPTVYTDVALADPLMTTELFAPILPILSTPSLPSALATITQVSPSPLGLYVFTEDASEAEFVIARSRSGGVAVNDTMAQISVPNLPFGGVGASGFGAYHGKASVDTFSHRRSVVNVPTGAEVEGALEWRYAGGDQRAKWRFFKENLDGRLEG